MESFLMKLILVDSEGHTLCIFGEQHEALHRQSLSDSLVVPLVFSSTRAAGAIHCKRGEMNREPHNSCSSFRGQHGGDKQFKQGTKTTQINPFAAVSHIRASERETCRKPTQKSVIRDTKFSNLGGRNRGCWGGAEPLPACFCRAGRTAGLPATPRPGHRAAGCTTGLGGKQTRGVSPLPLPRPAPAAGPRPASPRPDGGSGGCALTRRPSLPPALAVLRQRLRGADGSPSLLGNPGGGGPGAGAARAPGEVRLRARPAGALRRQGAVAMGNSAGGGVVPPSPQSPGCGGPRGEAVSALLRPRRIPARSIPVLRAGASSAGKRSPPAPAPAGVCSGTCRRGAPQPPPPLPGAACPRGSSQP